jgi:ribonuclease HI
MAKKKSKFYAYLLPDTGESGILPNWPECQAIVSGRNARYRGFPTRAEAMDWLRAGAPYPEQKIKEPPPDFPEDAVFFDAGTGGGGGTRARITDRTGDSRAHLAVDEDRIDAHGNVPLPGRTNNYGELFSCNMALHVAELLESSHVFGDSKLVLSFWSTGHLGKKTKDNPDLRKLARETARLRKAFEERGGTLARIPGHLNPADLGFHR